MFSDENGRCYFIADLPLQPLVFSTPQLFVGGYPDQKSEFPESTMSSCRELNQCWCNHNIPEARTPYLGSERRDPEYFDHELTLYTGILQFCIAIIRQVQLVSFESKRSL